MNGVNCYKVKSKRNSNYIFLPAAGWGYRSSLSGRGSYGYYWSGSPCEGDDDAFYFYFRSGYYGPGWSDRYGGRSVRPVAE